MFMNLKYRNKEIVVSWKSHTLSAVSKVEMKEKIQIVTSTNNFLKVYK